LAAGVARESIIIDPAHDFGKTTLHSLEITRRLDELVATGWPVLVSVSNKDFLGETLGLPTDQRVPATLAATAICAFQGAQIHRVHQVAEVRQVVDFVASVRGERRPSTIIRGIG
jgi:dihydropteroate synthase